MKSLVFLPIALLAQLLIFSAAAHGESCQTTKCHAALALLKHPHAPVKDGECVSCHKQLLKEHPAPAGKKSFELSAQGGALCAGCHDPLGKRKFQHKPVQKGECASCHKPHGSDNPFGLEVGEDQTRLCTKCHDSSPFRQKFMHGPTAVGSCTACHEPHDANERGLMKRPVRDLCLQCHADFNSAMNEAGFVHPPVKNSPCTVCHDPHGAPVMMFLKNKVPDLCTDCHKPMAKKLAEVKYPHKPVLQDGGCSNCHAPHYSKAGHLLPADEMTVCLSCHGKDNLGKPPLKNIKTQIEGKKYLHGPIKKGSCKACHDPHGSNYFRMLPGSYPADLYVAYKDGVFDACLTCHEKNLLRFAETTLYTKFRNGGKNLHFVHVSTRKGRTCRICHEPHASDEEKLINKDGLQFGEWRIPLNFKITPTGGSCAPGCHRLFKYDRENPVPPQL